MTSVHEPVSDEEILDVFEGTPEPAMFANEVAEAVGYTRQGAANRLDDLVERGILNKKKSGKRSAVYWLPEGDSCSSKNCSPS